MPVGYDEAGVQGNGRRGEEARGLGGGRGHGVASKGKRAQEEPNRCTNEGDNRPHIRELEAPNPSA